MYHLDRSHQAFGREARLTAKVWQWNPTFAWYTPVRPDALIQIDGPERPQEYAVEVKTVDRFATLQQHRALWPRQAKPALLIAAPYITVHMAERSWGNGFVFCRRCGECLLRGSVNLLEVENYDVEIADARLLGQDIAAVLSHDTRARVTGDFWEWRNRKQHVIRLGECLWPRILCGACFGIEALCQRSCLRKSRHHPSYRSLDRALKGVARDNNGNVYKIVPN